MMKLDPVNPIPIPTLMKRTNQWVLWQAGSPDRLGKFAKYPIHAVSKYKINPHNSDNQTTFETALYLSSIENNLGIGYVLNGTPISTLADGEAIYLVGVDIDKKAGLTSAQLKELWLKLKMSYVEVSPSKTGIRIFCLSKILLPNRNRNGLEIYTSKRFLTVTGWSGRGDLIECTDQIQALHKLWFPEQKIASETSSPDFDRYPPPDTPRNRAWIHELLGHIDPDCDYETYRNVIWSIESLGWPDSEAIGRNWSLGALERFTEDGFTVIRSSFDGRRGGITFGTLVHYAKNGGWNSLKYRKGAQV